VEVEALQKGYKRDAPGWASGRVDEQKIQWQLFLVRFSYVELGLGAELLCSSFCLFLRPFPGAIIVGGVHEEELVG
jgi:hypothetical protein